MNLSSYYFSFESTGNKDVDMLLYAVARAGKCFHSTDQWVEEIDWVNSPLLEGNSPVDWIQNAANNLAKSLEIKNESK